MTSLVGVDARAGSFAGLLAAVAGGECWAVESVAVMCLPKLRSYARTRGAADPDGIADVVLADFFGRVGGLAFEVPGQMWSYLYRVTHSRVVDERRRAIPVEYVDGRVIDNLAPPSSGFDERVVDREYLDGLLSTLTTDQREVLEIRFFDDCSIEETAVRTGRTQTAVKGLQRRAIRALAAAALVAALIFGWTSLNDRSLPTSVITHDELEPATDGQEGSELGGRDLGGGTTESGLEPQVLRLTDKSFSEDGHSATFRFEVNGEYGPVGFECRMDGVEFSPCASPWSYRDLGEGRHVFEVRAIGPSGGVGTTPESYTWVAVSLPGDEAASADGVAVGFAVTGEPDVEDSDPPAEVANVDDVDEAAEEETEQSGSVRVTGQTSYRISRNGVRVAGSQ